MRLPIVTVVAVVALGCAPPSAGPCRLEAGTFRAVFTETAGTCGPIGSTTVVLNAEGGPPISGGGADCTGPVTLTADACNATFDRECAIYDDDGALLGTASYMGANAITSPTRIDGSLTRYSDGPGTEVDCVSMYDITWTRL